MMATLRNLVIFLVLALAIGQLIEARKMLADVCNDMKQALNSVEGVTSDAQKAFEHGKKFLLSKATSTERKLITAWEAIMRGDDCSKSTWEYLKLMGSCKPEGSLQTMVEPTTKYATKCLTPEMVDKEIKSKIRHASVLDKSLVNEDFIRKYQEMNPDDTPLHIGNVKGERCCSALRSRSSVIYAIEQEHVKRGKSVLQEFYGKIFYYRYKYTVKKLIKPCSDYVSSNQDFMRHLDFVTRFYEGGSQALVKSLTQESKNVIFRYNYCDDVDFYSHEMSLLI